MIDGHAGRARRPSLRRQVTAAPSELARAERSRGLAGNPAAVVNAAALEAWRMLLPSSNAARAASLGRAMDSARSGAPRSPATARSSLARDNQLALRCRHKNARNVEFSCRAVAPAARVVASNTVVAFVLRRPLTRRIAASSILQAHVSSVPDRRFARRRLPAVRAVRLLETAARSRSDGERKANRK